MLTVSRSVSSSGHRGFTIVELLIVIVVIGILAAISLVAFGGIKSRAIETTIRSDLAAFHKKVSLFNAEYGRYPAVGAELTNNIRMPFSRSSYVQDNGNFIYCTSTGASQYLLVVRGNNAKNYYSGSEEQFQVYTGPGGTPATVCDSTGFTTAAGTWGFEPSISGWGNPGYRAWTSA